LKSHHLIIPVGNPPPLWNSTLLFYNLILNDYLQNMIVK